MCLFIFLIKENSAFTLFVIIAVLLENSSVSSLYSFIRLFLIEDFSSRSSDRSSFYKKNIFIEHWKFADRMSNSVLNAMQAATMNANEFNEGH